MIAGQIGRERLLISTAVYDDREPRAPTPAYQSWQWSHLCLSGSPSKEICGSETLYTSLVMLPQTFRPNFIID